MRFRMTMVVLVASLAALCMPAQATSPNPSPQFNPSRPPDMKLEVSPGADPVKLPDGKAVQFETTRLEFDPPQMRKATIDAKAPADYAAHFASWQPWPSKYKGTIVALSPKPKYDEQGTLILGGLFRQIDPDSIVVTLADGSKTFVRDKDYRVNADWGQIANIGGRLGERGKAPLKVTYTMALQRIDLVQVSPAGKVTVKKGTSRIVCPQLPEPDPGHAAIAGVYIAPWQTVRNPKLKPYRLKNPAKYSITRHEVYPVYGEPIVEPVNAKAVARTLAKLRDGKEARIAFMGASITLGAEAGPWWDGLWTEKNLGYPSRVVTGLRKRFPKATVTPIASFKGGTTTAFGLERMEEDVVPKKPDLVLIAFGGNDVAGPVGKPPRNPPEKYKEDMRKLIRRAKQAGAEVMMVCIMQQNPWLEAAPRWPAYRDKQLELVKEENCALADVYSEWMMLGRRGVPPFTQLHNWINHPGAEGHKLFADVILRFFE